jgi:hypothetical protein
MHDGKYVYIMGGKLQNLGRGGWIILKCNLITFAMRVWSGKPEPGTALAFPINLGEFPE